MDIALITKPGHTDSGIGRYTHELARAIRELGHEVTIIYPIVPLPAWLLQTFRRWLKWDLESFFNNYPIWVRYPAADIFHLASQNMATLMFFRRPPGRVIVTVHDIIPNLFSKHQGIAGYDHFLERVFDRISTNRLDRCSAIISVSAHTKRVLVEELHIDPNMIHVVHEGVDTVRNGQDAAANSRD